uniref:Putative secreted protein n=1 Tax=Anopheles darlingi TaxID=43151 RepID=A0A2M4D887_ANODA
MRRTRRRWRRRMMLLLLLSKAERDKHISRTGESPRKKNNSPALSTTCPSTPTHQPTHSHVHPHSPQMFRYPRGEIKNRIATNHPHPSPSAAPFPP